MFVKDFEQSGRCQVKSCIFWKVGVLSPMSKNLFNLRI